MVAARVFDHLTTKAVAIGFPSHRSADVTELQATEPAPTEARWKVMPITATHFAYVLVSDGLTTWVCHNTEVEHLGPHVKAWCELPTAPYVREGS
jgi:hypothetical protein